MKIVLCSVMIGGDAHPGYHLIAQCDHHKDRGAMVTTKWGTLAIISLELLLYLLIQPPGDNLHKASALSREQYTSRRQYTDAVLTA